MKVKSDFVTNSSSNCYLVLDISKNGRFKEIDEVLEKCSNELEYVDLAQLDCTFYNLRDLDEYTNDGPLDWVQEVMGPKMWNLGMDTYAACKEIFENHKGMVHMIHFDRNMDISDELEQVGLRIMKVYYN